MWIDRYVSIDSYRCQSTVIRVDRQLFFSTVISVDVQLLSVDRLTVEVKNEAVLLMALISHCRTWIQGTPIVRAGYGTSDRNVLHCSSWSA